MKFHTTILILLSASNLLAQSRMVKGYVYDYETREPIQWVDVRVGDTKFGTFTDDKGYFEYEVAQNEHTLMFKHISYFSPSILINDSSYMELYLPRYSNKKDPINLRDFPVRYEKENALTANRWRKISHALGNAIARNKNYVREPFTTHVYVRIDEEGMMKDYRLIPNVFLNRNVVIEALSDMKEWYKLQQRSYPVEHTIHFELIETADQLTNIGAEPYHGFIVFHFAVSTFLRVVKGIEDHTGTIWISFLVSKKGEVTNMEIMQGVDQSLDQAILERFRLSQYFSNWRPASFNGQRVEQRFVLPVVIGTAEKDSLETSEFKNWTELEEVRLYTEQNSEVLQEAFNWRPSDTEIDLRPSFPGGEDSLKKYTLSKMLKKAPPIPINPTNSTVLLDVFLDKEGKVTKAKVISGLTEAHNENAIDLCMEMPNWLVYNDRPEVVRVRVPYNTLSHDYLEEVSSLSQQASDSFYVGKTKQAFELIDEAIEMNPTNSDLYYKKAFMLINTGQNKEACEVIERFKSYNQEAIYWYNENCK